ncbi:DinB family protein [Aeromicrobium sp. NPDC092404]|uniref:DinB family protein n=1 Tax=Aeromicrobium sp. NPDC092404 TaxID=3154976 RepID=UPI00341B7D3F
MNDIKHDLQAKLRDKRAALLASLDGLGEYDLRRPMTPTGTNLLGLVKHLVGVEHVYFGDSFDRTPPDVLPWNADGSVWEGADMWARADESSDDILDLYRRACEHSDTTIEQLDIAAPGRVPHWPAPDTTLGYLLVWVLDDTAQHAGHADIVRELIDGRTGSDTATSDTDWSTYVQRIQAAADTFR